MYNANNYDDLIKTVYLIKEILMVAELLSKKIIW